MTGRRTLVTGTDQPLGAAVATRLRLDNEVVAIGEQYGYDEVAGVVMDEQIDTIIHAGLVRWRPQHPRRRHRARCDWPRQPANRPAPSATSSWRRRR